MSKNLEDSVVLITSSSSESKYKDVIGTGFVIYREAETTYVLTCAHVVDDVGGQDNVQIYDKQATVRGCGDIKSFDLAVVAVENGNLIEYPVLKLKLQNSGQEETSVKAAGYYLYSEEKKRSLKSIEGVLGTLKYLEDQDTGKRARAWEVKINKGRLQKGYSGSPVVDQDSGCVIGVVTNMEKGGQKGETISVEALENICPCLTEKLKQLEPGSPSLIRPPGTGVDYTKKLQKLLEQNKWKEADTETAIIMLQMADRKRDESLGVEDVKKITAEDLRKIDELWLKYSNGKFGFSIQKKIYQSLSEARENNQNTRWDRFSEHVGWSQSGHLNLLNFDLTAPEGHLPSYLGYSMSYQTWSTIVLDALFLRIDW